MDFVSINDQVSDWGLGISAINGDAKSVVAVSRCIAAVKSLLNVMDVVLQQFYMGAGSHDAYTQWAEPMCGGAEGANFKSLDSHVALVVNREYCLSSSRREMCCIKNGRFPRRASKRNESI